MMRLWHCVIPILLFTGAICRQKCKIKPADSRPVYTFEDFHHLSAFSPDSEQHHIRLSDGIYKEGAHSMMWTWNGSNNMIAHNFYPIKKKELDKGGIKLWLYNEQKFNDANLTVSFKGRASVSLSFNITLYFKGWRAIWVAYRELLPSSFPAGTEIDTMEIKAIATSLDSPRRLYFDLIRLVKKLNGQTRDEVVPPIHKIYEKRNYWQQTYRWSKQDKHPNSDNVDLRNFRDFRVIKQRLLNWFVHKAKSSATFSGDEKKRFDSLRKKVDRSHAKFVAMGISKRESVSGNADIITGTPMYARDSEFNNVKFGYVMSEILLPMALDYRIRSRKIDVEKLAQKELPNLNEAARKDKAIKRIAGADSTMQNTFSNELGQPPSAGYTENNVQDAIKKLNDKRRERLLLLLGHIEHQGFTSGSGLGSLDHEMNKDGAGFMCTAFLLQGVFRRSKKLSDYIDTMKWYTDFGEVYQNHFEYTGTTADRMRTISLWRLFAVLMMPASTQEEKKQKVRDMLALKKWYENALTPTEAFAGLLKPDYVGFHHNSYYASAYTPQALHVAAFIQFLLSGTRFALESATRGHIRKGLETMRILSVKYSSPNGVSGRFPGFSRAILSNVFPAYAYAGATAPPLNSNVITFDQDGEEVIKMFLRLYDRNECVVNSYMADGSISSAIYYMNTIGSVRVIEEIHAAAINKGLSPESSPEGFWSKNYAALAVYRRDDWAVSVKGFNRFVWDFEGSNTKKENIFGIYQSHGALLVANNETSLRTHDVDNGWDWTRHPGVTTIKMGLEQLIASDNRYFQTQNLTGSVRLLGSSDTDSQATGVWGMDFKQPTGQFPAESIQSFTGLEFKKSVFFADNYVICLGSSIKSVNSGPYFTQTAIFQNKLLQCATCSSGCSYIQINSIKHSLEFDLTENFQSLAPNANVTLVDVNGNGYYIPRAREQGLNVKISLQNSKDQRGKKSSARYATAWLDHGVNPLNKNYHYTIAVGANGAKQAKDLETNQTGFYQVLHNSDSAHVVKMNTPHLDKPRYGYVVFSQNEVSFPPNSPVEAVRGPSIIMVEAPTNNNRLYIAVSSPDLNFNHSSLPKNSNAIKSDDVFYLKSEPTAVEVTLKDAVQEEDDHIRELWVDEVSIEKADYRTFLEFSHGGRSVKFKNLVKGFTTEIHLNKK